MLASFSVGGVAMRKICSAFGGIMRMLIRLCAATCNASIAIPFKVACAIRVCIRLALATARGVGAILAVATPGLLSIALIVILLLSAGQAPIYLIYAVAAPAALGSS